MSTVCTEPLNEVGLHKKPCQIWFAQPWNMCCKVILYKTLMVILPIFAIYNNIMANAFVFITIWTDYIKVFGS